MLYVESTQLCSLEYRAFATCPICGSGEELTAEHVPAEDLGGQVMTTTCAPCNNRHGSRTEPWLSAWYNDLLPSVRVGHPEVPGFRSVGDMSMMTNFDGRFVILTRSGFHPAVRSAALRTGRFDLSTHCHQDDRRQVAALKHAYLAACINLGEVPTGAEAAAIRNELVVARDAPKHLPLPSSPRAASLRLFRSFDRLPGVPNLAIHGVATTEPGRVLPIVTLAGRIGVEWPFEEIDPRLE